MSTTDLRIIKTKQALHAALLTLLSQKPLEQISIAEICREAKVNRGTFYLHYEQKEGLFEEYFQEIMEDLYQSYEEPYRAVTTLDTHQLDPNTIRIFHHIERFKMFYCIVFSKNVPLTYYYMLFDGIYSLLKRDITLHHEHQMTESISFDYYSAYQANAIIGLIIQWYRGDFKDSVSVLNQQLAAILKNVRSGG
ncbi:TetR/AcrR family transcriptional regulator [Lysinibacillus fusiformis]|uniref:TetR/AcrR family transcriptional regulator n=1 Tax=Lysinibacillus fusiformis TaxID=28031 RepID=UPI0023A92D58|nr:TetR/AcrR family transcriptional regulator [Lysinibacillus fusiformis]WEA40854.1 TetR/AcrR family transcriptional regulator [Lysinibacillus fusiformis]